MVPLYWLTMASQPAMLDVPAVLYVLAALYVLAVLYVSALLHVLAVVPVLAICVQQLLREWPMRYYQPHLFLSHAVVLRCYS